MLVYKNCTAIRSGIMPVHTLQIENKKISVVHMNSLNQESIKKYYSIENGFSAAAIAFDRQGNKYIIMASNAGSVAIIQDYKRIFKIP